MIFFLSFILLLFFFFSSHILSGRNGEAVTEIVTRASKKGLRGRVAGTKRGRRDGPCGIVEGHLGPGRRGLRRAELPARPLGDQNVLRY